MANVLDISSSRRIELLTRLMREMAELSNPTDAIEVFSRGMQMTYESVRGVHLSTLGLAPGEYRVSRLATSGGVEHLPPGAALDYASLPVRSGGVLSEVIGAGRPCVVHELDLSADPTLGELLGDSRSLAAVPVLDPTLPVNWIVLLHPDPRRFDVRDLEELVLRVNLVGAITKGLTMSQQLAAANLRIAREIEQIARIQRTLLPAQLPEIPGMAIAAHYETFDRAGGDLYDFARMEGDPTTTHDDRWAVLIADASGHGPAAATVCAIVHSILHAYPQEPSGPAELLGHVNRQLCEKQIESSFVTAFLAFYQPATRELVYARAGHNPPLLVSEHCDGGRRALRCLDVAKGLPLGIDADARFDEARLTLEPGQMVILYTDGVTEAKNAAGEQLEVDGVIRALAACGGGADAAVRRLTAAVQAHLGDERAGDDRTIVVLEVLCGPEVR
jgi:sigma-B regulation protein RsbU (phosphoserine phosphatase)